MPEFLLFYLSLSRNPVCTQEQTGFLDRLYPPALPGDIYCTGMPGAPEGRGQEYPAKR